jgi:phosphoglycerol transferase MdoB-like AlkP superfamily enzyme
MKGRIKYILSYWLFWLLLFILGKLIFLLYQFNQSFKLPFFDWIRIIQHGFRLDLSTLGYISIFPVLVICFSSFWKGKTAGIILNIYTFILILIFIIITLVDLEIFRAWSVHFDSAPLHFLSQPREVIANVEWYQVVLILATVFISVYYIFKLYRNKIGHYLSNSPTGGWKSFVLFLLIPFLLFTVCRGGLGTTPINISSAYFHKNVFANQAAINVFWYFGHSVAEGKETKNPYRFFKDENYADDLKKLYTSSAVPAQMLNTDKPTIILIIMETFTAKLVEPLGGPAGVTPNFNRLSREGIFFKNMFANGTRTDRGMVSIISGFPTVEPITVLKYPEKTHKMPFISKDLKQKGYEAFFYYGGDVNFANMKSYLINGGFNEIYAEKDFVYNGYRSNWGIPDYFIYDKLYEAVVNEKEPSFHVMLTLSHHEPFDIPVEPHFKGPGIRNKFYSSAYFADSCLGAFIYKLKSTEKWKSSLIIIVADHGSAFPDFSLYHEPAKYRIPMLWLGGAVKKDTVISKYCVQSDIAVSLLHQLGIESKGYVLGKDIFSPSSGSFTFYSFMDGMAMMSDSLSFGYDFISKRILFSTGNVTPENIRYVKSLQQFVYDYYLSL